MDNQIGTKTSPGAVKKGVTALRVPGFLLCCWADFSKTNFGFTVFFLACLSIICGTAVFIGAVPTRIYGHDNFFLLDNGWRILCGQRPHIDFFSPWGPVMFLVVGMGLEMADTSVNGIGCGNAIVGLIIGLMAFRLGRNRLASLPRFFLSIYFALLVTAPYPLGIWPNLSSHANLYNRYGYALLGLVLIECFQREECKQQDAGEMCGGISTGAIVAVTFFLKASYFCTALPIVGASILFRGRSDKRSLGLALGFCVVFVAMLAYLRFEIGTVVEALWMAAGARSKALSFGLLLAVQLMSQVPAFLTTIGVLFLGTRRSKPVGSWLDNYRWIILGLLILASDSLLMLSNAQILQCHF